MKKPAFLKVPAFAKVIALPFAISALFAIVSAFSLFGSVDGGIYDAFLRVKPAPAQWDKLLLVDIDDKSINDMGEFPWPRNLMADQLLLLSEFGADYVVFDIEYINKSQRGLNKAFLDTALTRTVDSEFVDLQKGIADTYSSLVNGQLKLGESWDYFKQVIDYVDIIKSDIFADIDRLAVDADDYLGRSLGFFGNGFLTLNFGGGNTTLKLDDTRMNEDSKIIAMERDSIKDIEVRGSPIPEAPMFLTPNNPIFKRAKGSGFVDVVIDPDGKRRRIYLIQPYGGKWYPQLGFAPLLDYYGDPKILLEPRALTLVGAAEPGKPPRDIRIPLDSSGQMLINWPKENYETSFVHLPMHSVWYTSVLDTQLYINLSEIARTVERGLPIVNGLLSSHDDIERFKDDALAAEEGSIVASRAAEYRVKREEWIGNLAAFISSDVMAANLAAIDEAIANPKAKPDYKAALAESRAKIEKEFASLKENYELFKSTRDTVKGIVAGKFCIIGWTGTGTTDLGVNSFHAKYANVGTHASVINTIVEGDFISEAPTFISPLLGMLLSITLVVFIRKRPPYVQNIVGIGSIVGFVGIDILLFVLLGVYVSPVAPFLALFFTFIGHSLQRFLGTEREKTFLRKAFSTYLSDDVIEKIVSDPKTLKLGGDDRHMTAIFTDVQGFSTLSEKLDPVNLVHLLNEYLGSMSDIVLEEKGTIDKYEGDAIIAFYNAPVDLPAHAAAACRSALLMKRKEAELNDKFLAQGMSPVPLFTRIGINTGRMVVGNMGTERKMNYTIMGNSVNLAARLEGVNKRYGTWILTSDTTRKEAGDDFLFRPLDRVRVVGIHEPVRLHEVLCFSAEADQKTKDKLGLFAEALALFESRKWDAAIAGFDSVLDIDPKDGPSLYYVRNAKDFRDKPPAVEWDGVFNLTEK